MMTLARRQIIESNDGLLVKVIPQKKELAMNFFETFPECSPASIVSKKKIK